MKRSRFICHLARVGDEEQAQEFIAGVRKRYWDARHNCTAFVVGEDHRRERSSDDGEPGGTAGVPMLEVLRRRGLTDTVAVVTRYFGGVLLGAGGLVRAYGGAVSAAVDAVGTVERRPVALLVVAADHTRAGRLENDLRAAGHAVRDCGTRPRASGSRWESRRPVWRPSTPGSPRPAEAPRWRSRPATRSLKSR